MALRCVTCGRLSRSDAICEWCETAMPPAAGTMTADAGEVSEQTADEDPGAAAPDAPDDSVEPLPPEAVIAAPEPWWWDTHTRAIIALIAVQFALTLYLGRLSSWWSVTGILWLVVGYGVIERLAWSVALPLVLFTLDVALLLFGIGPRQRAGFISLAPLDFFLYLIRLVAWALIFRLRDEMD